MTEYNRNPAVAMARRSAMAVLAGGALAACAVQLPGAGQPPRIYVLSPKSTFPDEVPVVDWQLLVDTPLAAAGIAGSRIALRRKALELQYFARASWTDSAPKMIQRLLIESFENSNKIVSVGRQAIGLRSDFVLKTDLREFQAEYTDETGAPLPDGAPPNIHIRLNAKLVRMPHRTIVASRTTRYYLPAPGTEMDDIVRGFDSALGKTLKRVISWTLIEGKRIRDEKA